MSAFQLKLLALLTMVIDHIGMFFFPEVIALRLVGRTAFPIFCFLLANGSYYSHSKFQYLKKLLVFAVIAQVPFLLVHWLLDSHFWGLNVLFTLSFGLIGIIIIQRYKSKVLRVISVASLCILAAVLNADYTIVGVLSCVLFYIYFKDIKKLILSQLFLYLFFYMVPILLQILTAKTTTLNLDIWQLYEPVGLLSLIPIAFYSKDEGPKTKYFLYAFYPVHLLVIYLVKMIGR